MPKGIYKRTEKTKEILRKAKLGTKQSPEQIKNRFRSRKGYRHSVITKEKIKLSLIGHVVSEETKAKFRKRTGERASRWKGGITPINKAIRNSFEYKLWRTAVLERDNYTCIWCGATENLHADHIKPFAYFPELRFAIDNGRTLCIDCHKTTDTWGNKQ